MAAMLGPRGPSVAAALGPGGPIMGDHRWHDRPHTLYTSCLSGSRDLTMCYLCVTGPGKTGHICITTEI